MPIAAPAPADPGKAAFAVPGAFFTEPDARRIADAALEYGWYSPIDRQMVRIAGGSPWGDEAYGPATRRALHAWEPLDPLLTTHSFQPQQSGYLMAAATYGARWLALELPASQPSLGIAGKRAIRLAYLADSTRADNLLESAREHITVLMRVDPSDVSIETTDAIVGAVTLIGRLGTALGVGAADTAAAAALLDTHLTASFTSDGIHRSQAPGIQREVTESLAMLIDAHHVTHAAVGEVRRRAERALAWFVAPDGHLANFGATTDEPISAAYDPVPSGVRFLPERIADSALLHAASAGRHGAAPLSNRGFPEGGFVVIKEHWPGHEDDQGSDSHLVMRTGPAAGAPSIDAGLGFTWFDRGRRLIVEPGPIPTDSDHPAAEYAQRPDAHNQVVVGAALGADAARNVPGQQQPTAPQRWGMLNGHYVSEAHELIGGAHHRRSVLYQPGSWLLIADTVDASHDQPVAVRFHAAEDLGIIAAPDRFTMLDATRPVMWAVELGAQRATGAWRGEYEPVPNGWWSPDGIRMVPNWVFGWDATGPTTFVTLLGIDHRPEALERDTDWFGWQTARYRARVAVTESGIADVEMHAVTGEERG